MRHLRRTFSARVFGLLYLLVMVLYAGAYDRLLGDFYESTAIYDTGYQTTADNLVTSLNRDIQSAAVNVTSTPFGPQQLQLTPATVELQRLTVVDQATISFDLRYTCTGPTSVAHVGMTVSLEGFKDRMSIRTRNGAVIYGYSVQETQEDKICGVTIAPLAGLSRESATGALIAVRLDTATSLTALLRAKGGFSDQLPGRPLRAAYLSAVTITTLGFGDVVPVSDGARLLVASEAVIGVVLAGLFLNAVARRRDSQPQKDSDSKELNEGGSHRIRSDPSRP